MEEYNFERLDKVPGRNKRLPNHLRRTEKQKLRVYVAQYIGFMVEQTRIHQVIPRSIDFSLIKPRIVYILHFSKVTIVGI